MRMTWRSILPSILMLTVLPLCLSGATPRLQEPSSGATSTKHDSIIKGTVTTSNGKKNVHVTLTNLATEEKTETQTDELGRFQFSGLYSGKYKLEAATEAGETVSAEVSLAGSETRELVLEPITAIVKHDINLRHDPSTTSAALEHLVEGDRLTLVDTIPLNGFYHVRTEEGQVGWVSARYVNVLPTNAGSSSGAASSNHHAVIIGKVTGANGERQKYAQVALINLETEEKREMQTDKSGHFQFSELYSGKYRLEVKTESGETASYEVSLGSGETVIRKIVVKRQE